MDFFKWKTRKTKANELLAEFTVLTDALQSQIAGGTAVSLEGLKTLARKMTTNAGGGPVGDE